MSVNDSTWYGVVFAFVILIAFLFYTLRHLAPGPDVNYGYDSSNNVRLMEFYKSVNSKEVSPEKIVSDQCHYQGGETRDLIGYKSRRKGSHDKRVMRKVYYAGENWRIWKNKVYSRAPLIYSYHLSECVLYKTYGTWKRPRLRSGYETVSGNIAMSCCWDWGS